MEAIQGIIPGWISTGLNYIKEIAIPFMIAKVGYESSAEGNLVATMQAQPTYLKTCLWILAFLVFGYALANALKAIIIKLFYDIEGEKKLQMYRDLEKMREERHKENEAI